MKFVCFSASTSQLTWYKNDIPFRVYTPFSRVNLNQLVYEDGVPWGTVTLTGIDHDDKTDTNLTSTLIVPIIDEGVVSGDVIACGNPDIFSTDNVTVNYTSIGKFHTGAHTYTVHIYNIFERWSPSAIYTCTVTLQSSYDINAITLTHMHARTHTTHTHTHTHTHTLTPFFVQLLFLHLPSHITSLMATLYLFQSQSIGTTPILPTIPSRRTVLAQQPTPVGQCIDM